MTPSLDLNADIGESFGRWVLGRDEELLKYVTSVSIACGYHAGDPHVMKRTVALAVEHGVAIGAHVGLPDLIGFGRRELDVTPAELADYVTYQTGALAAFAAARGVRLQHIKPHGVLFLMVGSRADYATAVATAIAEMDPSVALLQAGSVAEASARAAGISFIAEAYVDLDYRTDGSLVVERVKARREPDVAAARAVEIACHGTVPSVDGERLAVRAESVCIHGDSPNAPELARAVRDALLAAGIRVARPVLVSPESREASSLKGAGSGTST